jgi:hypothetical protein
MPGQIFIEDISPSVSRFPLMWQERCVVTLVWVSPWARQLLADSHPYFELDASFAALEPYAYVIPTAVLGNYGVPLGIVLTPTERVRSYELFWEHLGRRPEEIARMLHSRALLSDSGCALLSHGERYGHHFQCFRHILERLGSKTYLAVLARHLMFTATESEYARELEQGRICLEEAFNTSIRVTPGGLELFSRLFGYSVDNSTRQVTITNPQAFGTEALWGARGAMGVSSCTNHVEGLHGRLNGATSHTHDLPRRLKAVIDLLFRKARHFARDMHRSAKRKLRDLKAIAAREGYNADTCDCGWGSIYAKRFGLPNFPCVHTCATEIPEFPTVTIHWDMQGQVQPPERRDYTGAPWRLSRLKGGYWHTEETANDEEEQVGENGEESIPRENAMAKDDLGVDEISAEDADTENFLRVLLADLRRLNPVKAVETKFADLACAYGAFAAWRQGSETPDTHDMRTRAQYQVKILGPDLQ